MQLVECANRYLELAENCAMSAEVARRQGQAQIAESCEGEADRYLDAAYHCFFEAVGPGPEEEDDDPTLPIEVPI